MTRRPTPAPWFVRSDMMGGSHIYHAGNELEVVAHVPQDRLLANHVQDHEANARLIAAAPDLRDALEAFMAASSVLRIYEGTSDELRAKKEYTQAFNAARAALAKTTPQPQEDPA